MIDNSSGREEENKPPFEYSSLLDTLLTTPVFCLRGSMMS